MIHLTYNDPPFHNLRKPTWRLANAARAKKKIHPNKITAKTLDCDRNIESLDVLALSHEGQGRPARITSSFCVPFLATSFSEGVSL